MIGVLLVNLGTPDSASRKDVRKYLIEFLTDPRVIDYPWLKRQLLVRGLIVPSRYKNSADNYSKIWTAEGSPLKLYGYRVKDLLQEKLGEGFQVEIAMRYQNPSISQTLERMKGCLKIVVIPLFPQYASATTGSVHQKVMEEISRWITIPEVKFINSYPTQPEMIEAFSERARQYNLNDYDHFVFSYHGLPERQIRQATTYNYAEQCHATTEAIAKRLNLPEYTLCYQSRLGKEVWLEPYTSDTIEALLEKGKKNLLVFSPAFVCDCLETIDEIAREYRNEFISKGGNRLDLVAGLNDHPLWIEALKKLVTSELQHAPYEFCAASHDK